MSEVTSGVSSEEIRKIPPDSFEDGMGQSCQWGVEI